MTASDKKVREVVSTVFKKYVRQGNILDFGGGTGLDLSWETGNSYRVFFLEPSENMRGIAKQEMSAANDVVFIEENLDFRKWSPVCLPLEEKMEGILANFAVLNCIEDIETLFENLSMFSNKGGYLLATVLDTRTIKLVKNYSVGLALKSLLGFSIKIKNKQPGIAHSTYLHTLKQYKKAASDYFNFVGYTPILSSNFALLILSAK